MPAFRLRPLYDRGVLRLYGWATQRLYRELAWAYDPISRLVSAGRWDRWRRVALEYVAGTRALEIGFGTGELLVALNARGIRVVGADPSRQMHRVAGRKLVRAGVRAPRVLAVAHALPFADAAFDSVISTFPAGYILQRESLCELRRVLRPEGRLVIVGLAVELPVSARFPLSVVPGSWPPLWDYFQQVAEEAGLATDLEWRDDPPARVPVIVARPDNRENRA